MTNKSIIIIGPMSVGKTTVANLLATRLNMGAVHVDDFRNKYYPEVNFDVEQSNKSMAKGILEWHNYQKPFELHCVKRIMEDFQCHVIDFGGGHSVFDDERQFEQLKGYLSGVCSVFLLMPFDDIDKAAEFLSVRNAMQLEKEEPDMPEAHRQSVLQNMKILNDVFLRSPCNNQLADNTVYVAGKSTEQICDEILGLL